jgi:hypothetical protein
MPAKKKYSAAKGKWRASRQERCRLPFVALDMPGNEFKEHADKVAGAMKIAIGSDHAGFRYKEIIRRHLKSHGVTVTYFGTRSDGAADYPLFIRPVAQAVARGTFDRGIVAGSSGNGKAMTANRIRGRSNWRRLWTLSRCGSNRRSAAAGTRAGSG